MDNKERILEATISVFNRKGLKFTMDDIASELSMSKKTIYTVFRDKESLFFSMVDYCFGKIAEKKNAVLQDDSLSTVEKLKNVLSVLPDGYKDIDIARLYLLKDKYPKTYIKVQERLEAGWEGVIDLIEQGIKEGTIKPIKPFILKSMMEATIEHFFQRDTLVANEVSYDQALEEMVEIFINGIAVR